VVQAADEDTPSVHTTLLIYLAETGSSSKLLQLVNLPGSVLLCLQVCLTAEDLDQPGQEAAVLGQGLPL
jgi:hypothetical protein